MPAGPDTGRASQNGRKIAPVPVLPALTIRTPASIRRPIGGRSILPPLFFWRFRNPVYAGSGPRRELRFFLQTSRAFLAGDTNRPGSRASRCRRILSMANTTSAKKATRKIARRTAVNKSRRTRMRNSVRLVELAIEKGDREAALVALKSAEPELMRAAQRNIVHKNNASRKVSRLTHQIAKLAK